MMNVTTSKRGAGYDVYVDGQYVGYLRRPVNNVFESDARRYWDGFTAEGRKVATGRNIAEAGHYVAKAHWNDGDMRLH